MKMFTRSFALFLVSSILPLPQIARAQPDATAPKARNPPTRRIQDPALSALSPAQMSAYRLGREELDQRKLLAQDGISELETQNAILRLLRAQGDAREHLQSIAPLLHAALDSAETTDEQLRQQLEKWQAAASAVQLQSQSTTRQLQQKLALDEQPRLDALLRLQGFIGHETLLLGDAFGPLRMTVVSLPKSPRQDGFEAATGFDRELGFKRKIGIQPSAKTAKSQARWHADERESREQALRQSLNRYQFHDLEIQEIIIDFLRAQNIARIDHRLAAARLRDAIADPDTSAAQIRQLLQQWQDATTEMRTRRDESTKHLREKLHLNQRPRLEAVLSLQGVVGDETHYLNSQFVNNSLLNNLAAPENSSTFSTHKLAPSQIFPTPRF